MKRLTNKQSSILNFIRIYKAKSGESPTVREIGDAFGIKSTNGVTDHHPTPVKLQLDTSLANQSDNQ